MGDIKDVISGGGQTLEDVEANNVEADQNAGQAEEHNRAEVMAVLKNKLGSIYNSVLFPAPKSVQRAVKALKKIQLSHVNLEVEFFQELHVLEMQFEKKFQPLYEKRHSIVTGSLIPTEEECDFHSDSEKDSELTNELQKVKLEDNEIKKEEEDVKGIPEFWLTAFKNVPNLADMIEEYDEPILKHLVDVRAVTLTNPMSYILEFQFETNDYFTNSVLTKSYELKCCPDPSDVFGFEGPEIMKIKGCTIDWKKGKNVTVKTIKKKQKHKARGAVRTVTKTIQNDSFFNFFNPAAVPDEEQMDEDTSTLIHNDFETGNLIKDRLIPHAVLFFTGDLVDDFDEEEDDLDEEDFDDEEDDEDDDEENDNQSLNRKKSGGTTQTQAQSQPPECKQQ